MPENQLREFLRAVEDYYGLPPIMDEIEADEALDEAYVIVNSKIQEK